MMEEEEKAPGLEEAFDEQEEPVEDDYE